MFDLHRFMRYYVDFIRFGNTDQNLAEGHSSPILSIPPTTPTWKAGFGRVLYLIMSTLTSLTLNFQFIHRFYTIVSYAHTVFTLHVCRIHNIYLGAQHVQGGPCS